ncbi:glycosyltransferase family 2 protein [Candidatus Pelagibacter sp.]|jgi:polyisoprenyl-phosphate glycosyltransferase|nr:glycosyltransferase family 2 protein [Candidatus Pelagibacter sp.]
MKKISIVTPTFNEEENIKRLCSEIKVEAESLNYDYEHIIIDNSSSDKTIDILREIAAKDKNVKIIINSRNYGHIKSPFYGIMQATGDACILMVSDFQEPIHLITKYIKKWENGAKIVLGQKNISEENNFIFSLRKLFYTLLNKISETKLSINTTGTGLFDKKVIDRLKKINDPYPYFRGLISEVGFDIETIEFDQPLRKLGKTKNNFFTLYDLAMLGVVKHSRMPLRIMTLLGFISSFGCLFVAIIYLILKLIFWNSFELGSAPTIIGIFTISSIQIMLLGLLGEYIGVILMHQRNMPLVIEKERINF